MITKFLSRSGLHKHAAPAQRVLGVEQLPPDSEDLAHILAADPAPEVRAAAVKRCADVAVLAAAWETETDPAVRDAISAALGSALSRTQDSAGAHAALEADRCTDAIRSDVARRAQDPERRRFAIGTIRDEAALVALALDAEHAETRLAAAERVRTAVGLHKLADAAKNRDRGVARLARQRIDALNDRLWQEAEADAIVAQLEALAVAPGPILTAVVELDRRWQALDMAGDAARRERFGAARQTIQARFDREQEAQRARVQFERRLRAWIGSLGPTAPAGPDALAGLRTELAGLREEAQRRGDVSALAQLDAAEQRIGSWEQEQQALAGAESLVIEAEQLAAGTSADSADLLTRWQALDVGVRTPALTRRFEAALLTIANRRLAQVESAKQERVAQRHRLHGLLHAAEQALAAGQLQAARAAADEAKALRAGAGELPKPTTQRLARLLQQLAELERWESFGQHDARIRLCERAEAIAAETMAAPKLASEVQALRNEWKALDQQHAGVPRTLWLRFDRACEKAYAPAARHFAELAARNKEARKRREEFIAAAAAHASALLDGVRDWREIERWLRENDRAWRQGDLGGVPPDTRKKLDNGLRAALAPLRDALSAACDQAKAGRQAMIEEARALAAKATERETPSQVKAIQARWQENAKALPLGRHDERVLWEQFRAACDAVFNARQAKRNEEDVLKQEIRRALEGICVQLEQLARASERDDPSIRLAQRDLREQWNRQSGGSGPALRGLESRFDKANTAVDAMLSARARSREAGVWETLAAKDRLCRELDALVQSGRGTADPALSAAAQERWTALPALPAAWEQKMIARRDAALRALSDAAAADEYLARMERNPDSLRQRLVEIELLLGLDSPAELQQYRLALQVKQLKERFKGGATAGSSSPGELLLAWCTQSGVCGALDQQRRERIVSQLAKTRVRA